MTESSGARPRWRDRNWDAYAAVIASLMAVLALVVGAYTANLQRQQVRAQVWPRLQLSRSQERHVLVANRGTGPARVRAVRVELDRRPIKTWEDLLGALGHRSELERKSRHWGGSTINQAVIPAGQQVEAFTAHDNDAGRALFAAVFSEENLLKRIGILICYCSVLDQCWLAGGYSGSYADQEREIDECPIAERDRFTD